MLNYQKPLSVWEMHNSYGCTTIWMCLMPLIVHLKIVTMVNFIFYYNFKNPIANIILNMELLEAVSLGQDIVASSHCSYSTVYHKSSAIKHKTINVKTRKGIVLKWYYCLRKKPEDLYTNY